MAMNRRDLLAGAGAAALGVGAAFSGTALAQPDGPPKASVRPVTETLHGTTITDPYRWMETPSDPEWAPYLTGQNRYARAVLDRIPGRNELAQKIGDYSGGVAAVSAIQAAGPYVFTQARPAGANTFKLYVRDGMRGSDRLLIDPDILASADSHVSLDYFQVSPDGRYVAYGTSPAGSENSTLRIMETATGAILPDTLDRAQNGSPSWLPDSSGLFLNRLKAGTKHGDPDHYLDSVAWLHMLKADETSDLKVLTRGLDPAVAMQPIDFPVVQVQAGSDVALGLAISGVQNEVTMYASPLDAAVAGKPVWRKICDPADAVTNVAILGDDLYLMTHKDAPSFRLVKTSAAHGAFADAREVLPAGKAVLKAISTARDGVYIQAIEGGLARLLRLAPSGQVTEIDLPFDGSIAVIYTDPLKEGCWFVLDSWARPPVACFARPGGEVEITDIAPRPPYDTAAYQSHEVMVTARDGVQIPLSIVYKTGVARDGSAPLYLQAYGAYGLDIDPAFQPRILPWLDLGGVYAVAHVRGGGELGESWHQAGQKPTKPNTWRDCIDCAEHLIAEKWTSKGRLAVEGTSAGGIMIGRFMTERPDLLAVALVRVGDSNATRAQFMETGPANIPEFGDINDPVGFKGLLEMDAYQHVRDGTPYPAVMLTTGLTDPRVAPWEAGKMTARLQAATSSGKPVILRVETDAGHGLGSTRNQRDLETADSYAFILWQTGVPGYGVA
jgi:prolyl oligopeptidase